MGETWLTVLVKRCENTESWNQLALGLRASFPVKLNTSRKGVKIVVTRKGTEVGIGCK